MNKRMLIKAMLKLKCLTFSSSFLFSGLVLSSQSVASFFPGSEGAKRSAAGQFNPGQQVCTGKNNVRFCINKLILIFKPALANINFTFE